MHPIVNIAIRAARKAGTLISRSAERLDTLTVVSKSANDYVSEVDHAAERVIIETILKAYPDHAILAEESGQHASGKTADYQWIIDPLDGTTNFLHGFPQYAVSIGVQYRGRLEHGVIYDPVKDEMFSGSRGKGAQLNQRRLRVSSRKGLEGSLLGTGFPFRDLTHLEVYLNTFRALIKKTSGIRRPGSAALDLAYLAAGRIDGFWEMGLNIWDMAAGCLIIEEAGGQVCDFSGGENYLKTGNIIAGNPAICSEILEQIRPFLSADIDQ
ncbi:MAG: inositol monophosphatase [Gammaproteobacteria bacterium]|nr:MAG: inositol monophosphatase [Gammaproteobacteria bacterium]